MRFIDNFPHCVDKSECDTSRDDDGDALSDTACCSVDLHDYIFPQFIGVHGSDFDCIWQSAVRLSRCLFAVLPYGQFLCREM